jgi:hypothetical protein
LRARRPPLCIVFGPLISKFSREPLANHPLEEDALSGQPLASLIVALVLCSSFTAHGQTTLPDGAGKEILQSA